MTGMALATSHGTSYTPIAIVLGILLIIGATISIVVASYFRLQSHRADAVAMAHYRKLAEDAVTNQQELRDQLTKLTEKVQAVEKLMRDVG